MRKMFSKLKSNSGFSLVECIVAIAILAIMSAMVMAILSAAVNLRKQNSESEASIDSQVDSIIDDPTAIVSENFTESITFQKGTADEFEIKADAAEGITATRLYDDTADLQISAVDFDYTAYVANVINTEGGASLTAGARAYGGVQTVGQQITIQTPVNLSSPSGIVEVQWNCSFTLDTAQDASKSVKLKLPIGATITESDITVIAPSVDVKPRVLSDNSVRIGAVVGGDNVMPAGNYNVVLKFKMSAADYTNYYKSLSNYLNNKLLSTDTVDLATNTVTLTVS